MDPAAERGRRTSPSRHSMNLRSTLNRSEQSTNPVSQTARRPRSTEPSHMVAVTSSTPAKTSTPPPAQAGDDNDDHLASATEHRGQPSLASATPPNIHPEVTRPLSPHPTEVASTPQGKQTRSTEDRSTDDAADRHNTESESGGRASIQPGQVSTFAQLFDANDTQQPRQGQEASSTTRRR